VGVVASILLGIAALVISLSNVFSEVEDLFVSIEEDDNFYTTEVAKAADGSRLFYKAKFDVLLTNKSKRKNSIVGLKLNFYRQNSTEAIFPEYGEGSDTTFVPINLDGDQSTLFFVYFNMPISSQCNFGEVPLGKRIPLSDLVAIFSKRGRYFPVCATVSDAHYPEDGVYGGWQGIEIQITSGNGTTYSQKTSGYKMWSFAVSN
jgi:hypothetical protein